jgi:hypothetical protein
MNLPFGINATIFTQSMLPPCFSTSALMVALSAGGMMY